MSRQSRALRMQRAEARRATEEIEGIRLSLKNAYAGFNSTSDPELVEACIYEINALKARYDHALKRAKSRLSY